MLRECDRSEGSVCYCTPKRNVLVNGILETEESAKQSRTNPPTTIVSTIVTQPVNNADRNVKASTWGGLKHAFRRSEDGSIFGQFTPWQVASIAVAELVGTAILLSLGCMGLIKGLGGDDPSHLQISLAFGMIVAAIIQIIGHVSKAHLNPAVTLCAVLLGDINVPTALVYVVAECLGAIIGYGLLRAVTPEDVWTGSNCCEHCVTAPAPGLTTMQALIAETLVTCVLIFLVCAVWDKRSANNQDSVALKFGFTIAAISMVEGPYTGASMNPARSLAPAVWTNVWRDHWIYWVGPLMASVLSTLFYKYIFNRESNELNLEDHDLPLTTVNSSKLGAHDSSKGSQRASKEDLAL